MKRPRFLTPKGGNIEPEVLLDKLKNLPRFTEQRVSVSEKTYEELEQASERLGIPLKYLSLLYFSRHPPSGEKPEESSVEEGLLPGLESPVKVTKDVDFYLSKPGEVYLDSTKADLLYTLDFGSYEEYKKTFSYIFNRERAEKFPYGNLAPTSEEYILPEELFQPNVPVRDWFSLVKESTNFYVSSVNEQVEVQDVLGRLMDSHYVEDSKLPEPPDWAFENAWEFRELALCKKLPANPYLLGRGHRIAPVEVLVPAEEVVGISAEVGRVLASYFKKKQLKFAKLCNWDVLVFPRTGFFLIGNFPLEHVAVKTLKEILKDWLSPRKGGHYARFLPDEMTATAYGSWYDCGEIPSYHVTSSIAYIVGTSIEIEELWRKVVSESLS